MLGFIKRFLGKSTEPAPDPLCGIESCSEEQLLREHFSPTDAELEALAGLVSLLAARLGEEAVAVLSRKVREGGEPGEDAALLFASVTAPGAGSETCHLSIFIDWKAYEEIEWQVNLALPALGIVQPWSWLRDSGRRTAPEVLLDLDAWLGTHGYCLLHVDHGGDDYLAFPVRKLDVAKALALAGEAGLDIRTSEEFRSHCGVE